MCPKNHADLKYIIPQLSPLNPLRQHFVTQIWREEREEKIREEIIPASGQPANGNSNAQKKGKDTQFTNNT